MVLRATFQNQSPRLIFQSWKTISKIAVNFVAHEVMFNTSEVSQGHGTHQCFSMCSQTFWGLVKMDILIQEVTLSLACRSCISNKLSGNATVSSTTLAEAKTGQTICHHQIKWLRNISNICWMY